jgi:hypothetical protein
MTTDDNNKLIFFKFSSYFISLYRKQIKLKNKLKTIKNKIIRVVEDKCVSKRPRKTIVNNI